MSKFTVAFATRYNGVSISPNWDNIPDNESDDIDAVIDDISDDSDDMLSSIEDEHNKEWDYDLSSDDIMELRKSALAIINKYLPDITLDDVGFKYDNSSS